MADIIYLSNDFKNYIKDLMINANLSMTATVTEISTILYEVDGLGISIKYIPADEHKHSYEETTLNISISSDDLSNGFVYVTGTLETKLYSLMKGKIATVKDSIYNEFYKRLKSSIDTYYSKILFNKVSYDYYDAREAAEDLTLFCDDCIEEVNSCVKSKDQQIAYLNNKIYKYYVDHNYSFDTVDTVALDLFNSTDAAHEEIDNDFEISNKLSMLLEA